MRRLLTLGNLVVASAVLLNAAGLRADEVTYVDEGGLRYMVTKRVVPRLVIETTMSDQQQEVRKPKVYSETKQTTQTVYVPITEYRTEPVMRGRWNPFVVPYYEQRLVPVTRWEARQVPVNVPVVRQEFTTEKQTVRIPVTTQRWVDEEFISRQVVGRAIGPTPGGSGKASAAASTARRETTGKSSLEGEPTKRDYGTRTE